MIKLFFQFQLREKEFLKQVSVYKKIKERYLFFKFIKILNVKNQIIKIFKMEKNEEIFYIYCIIIMNYRYLVKFKYKRNII